VDSVLVLAIKFLVRQWVIQLLGQSSKLIGPFGFILVLSKLQQVNQVYRAKVHFRFRLLFFESEPKGRDSTYLLSVWLQVFEAGLGCLGCFLDGVLCRVGVGPDNRIVGLQLGKYILDVHSVLCYRRLETTNLF